MAKHGLARAAIFLMGLTLASRLLGFVREQFIAAYFGTTDVTDAYLVGNTLPNMLAGMLGTTVGLVFLPVYARRLASGDLGGAARLFNTVLIGTGVPSLLLVAIGFASAPVIVGAVAPGLAPEALDQAVLAFRLILPGAVFAILSSIVKAGLNAHREFTAPGWSPVAQNLCIIGAVVLTASTGVTGLSIGTLGGTVVYFLVQVPAWRRLRLSHPWGHSLREPEIRSMLRMGVPVVVTTLLTQTYQIFDRFFASTFPPGSVAALGFADRLRQLPIGIFSAVIATILYPRLSETVARQNWEGFRESVGRGVVLICLLMLPSAVLLASLSVPIVRLLFEHGAFDASATTATAGALVHYAMGITFAGLNGLILFALYSMLRVWDGLRVYSVTVVANLILDLLLVRLLGPAGLALGNSLALLLAFVLLSASLFRNLRREGAAAGISRLARGAGGDSSSGLPRELAKVLTAVAGMDLAVWTVKRFIPSAGAAASLTAQAWAVAAPAALGLAVYVAALRLLNVWEVRFLTEAAVSRLRRRPPPIPPPG